MKNLTIQHSLYLISNDELKEFYAFYERWKNVLPSISVNIHNDEDALATVLNCWVITKRYPAFPIKTTDKSCQYICNDYIHDLLNHSADIARIVQLWKNDEDRLFIFSYHLALHILHWVDFVLLNENEEIATAIFKVCYRRNYYVHNPHYLHSISDQAIHIKQRLVTSLLTQDNNRTNRMNQIIEKSIHETNTVFQIKKMELAQK
ncbi:MAG: hypothetical protein ACI33M_06900 [Lysinibacillus sp.]